MTYDQGEHSLKTSDPNLIRFWSKVFFEDFEEKDHWLTELNDYKGVYRISPVTPGLLNNSTIHS